MPDHRHPVPPDDGRKRLAVLHKFDQVAHPLGSIGGNCRGHCRIHLAHVENRLSVDGSGPDLLDKWLEAGLHQQPRIYGLAQLLVSAAEQVELHTIETDQQRRQGSSPGGDCRSAHAADRADPNGVAGVGDLEKIATVKRFEDVQLGVPFAHHRLVCF